MTATKNLVTAANPNLVWVFVKRGSYMQGHVEGCASIAKGARLSQEQAEEAEECIGQTARVCKCAK